MKISNRPGRRSQDFLVGNLPAGAAHLQAARSPVAACRGVPGCGAFPQHPRTPSHPVQPAAPHPRVTRRPSRKTDVSHAAHDQETARDAVLEADAMGVDPGSDLASSR